MADARTEAARRHFDRWSASYERMPRRGGWPRCRALITAPIRNAMLPRLPGSRQWSLSSCVWVAGSRRAAQAAVTRHRHTPVNRTCPVLRMFY